MKNSLKSRFIPVLTTEAGRCLTVDNWQEVGINIAAYDLTSLLMKPGIELLTTLPNLAIYTGWLKDIVLNAVMPEIDQDGEYPLRSEYDGSRTRYTPEDLLALIARLKPQLVLLPEGMHSGWQSLPNSILPFFSTDDLPKHTDRMHGVYFIYSSNTPFSTLVEQIQEHAGRPCYVGGELSVPLIQALVNMGVQYLSSDLPAHDGYQGLVYYKKEQISLKDETYRLDFNVIDEQCPCPTCKQQLTRSYLHHLLAHTPLLCQRFLIQHNARTLGCMEISQQRTLVSQVTWF